MKYEQIRFHMERVEEHCAWILLNVEQIQQFWGWDNIGDSVVVSCREIEHKIGLYRLALDRLEELEEAGTPDA